MEVIKRTLPVFIAVLLAMIAYNFIVQETIEGEKIKKTFGLKSKK